MPTSPKASAKSVISPWREAYGVRTPAEVLSEFPDLIATINGHEFLPIVGVNYKHDYRLISLQNSYENVFDAEIARYRELILTDLWFIVRFVLGNDATNHKFVVDACREVEAVELTRKENPNVLWVWARDHFKSTIITTALNIQRVLKNPELTIGIFSHTRSIAKAFLREIKQTFEQSALLKVCFRDVLWQDPQRDAPKWSEDDGIILRRVTTRKESTIEAWGLLEGMPTSKHFDVRDYDDILTQELVDSPDVIQKLKERFDMSVNLGTTEGICDAVGTYYHHQDVLVYLRDKCNVDGVRLFMVHKKTATDDGTPNGKPVLISLRKLKELQANRQQFYSQQLLDPTPQGFEKLRSHLLLRVPRRDLPVRLYKFMVIDPAGVRESDKRDGDAWAIAVYGVQPFIQDIAGSNTYLLDLVAKPMTLTEAMKKVVELYEQHGTIRKVGVEKVSMSTMEVHVQAALRAKGRSVTLENGRLHILRPEGRSKEERISALELPLNNGKMSILDSVSLEAVERLMTEMSKFPFWHDDILDTWAYLFDMLRDYRFPKYEAEESRPVYRLPEQKTSLGWMVQ